MKNKKFIALGAGLAVVVCITGIMLHHSGQEEAVEAVAAVGEEDTGAGEQAEAAEPETGEKAAEPEKPAEDTPDTPEEETVDNAAENGTEPAVETATEEQEETEPDIEALDKTMYAQAGVNIRKGPSVDYEKVGCLTINQEVKVTGQSKETGWYEIEAGGEKQYVSNKYLGDTKITVEQSPVSDTQQADSVTNPPMPPATNINGVTDASQFNWADGSLLGELPDVPSMAGIHAE